MKPFIVATFAVLSLSFNVFAQSESRTAFDNELYAMRPPGEWRENPKPLHESDETQWQWIGPNGEAMNLSWGKLKGRWPRDMLAKFIHETRDLASAEIDALNTSSRVEDQPAVKAYQPNALT